MKTPKWKQLLNDGRRKLDEVAKAAGVESGTQGVIDKFNEVSADAKRRADAAQERMADAAGQRLNALTGDDQSAARVAERYRKVEARAQQGMQKVRGAVDRAAGHTAERITEATGREVSKQAVKVGFAVTAAVVAGATEGLADVGGEAGLEGAGEGLESADAVASGQTEINMSQNGTVVTDGDTVYASVDGVTVKG